MGTMDWDLPQLRAFAAVVDHGTLDAAASALHLTPSAVSQRLKALERSVGMSTWRILMASGNGAALFVQR